MILLTTFTRRAAWAAIIVAGIAGLIWASCIFRPDEVVSADPTATMRLEDVQEEVQQDEQFTITFADMGFFQSQYDPLIDEYADRLYYLKDGCIDSTKISWFTIQLWLFLIRINHRNIPGKNLSGALYQDLCAMVIKNRPYSLADIYTSSYGTLFRHTNETFLSMAVIQPVVFSSTPLGYRRLSSRVDWFYPIASTRTRLGFGLWYRHECNYTGTKWLASHRS